MKAAFFADAHVGNHGQHAGEKVAGLNTRCRHVLAAIERALKGAQEADVVVSLGDLIDQVRPEPQVLRALQELFSAYKKPVALLLGNHERVSGLEKDHALMPLYVNNTVIFDRPGALYRKGGFVAMVPFQEGPAKEWIEGAIDTALSAGLGPCHALALHLGLLDEDIALAAPWLAQTKDAIDVSFLAELCRKYKIPNVFAGNWHRRKQWEFMWPDDGFVCTLTQVGALVPTGWDNPGLDSYGMVSVLGGEPFHVGGPRFVTVPDLPTTRRMLASAKALSAENLLYVRAKVAPSNLAAARAELRSELDGDPSVGGWSCLVDQDLTKEAARTAATAARSSQTMRTAVEAYFEKLDLEVDKDQALARTIHYLGLK